MSDENVEVVRSYYESSDLAAGIDLLADNVTLVFHGEARRLSGATTVSGKDSAVRWLADWFSRFGRDYSMTIDEVRDLDRGILVVTRHRATGRQSGASIDEKTAQIMLVNDGQIVRQEFFSDRDEALKAAGLSE